MKTALITGITGQDGAFLAKYLLSIGYRVYGSYRRSSNLNLDRIKYLGIDSHNELHLLEMDLTDFSNVFSVIKNINPNEVYNLAAQSFVGISFKQPSTTAHINSFGPLHILESIKQLNQEIKFYQASTSEMFGMVQEIPQSEKTPFYPRSPYGISKLFSHWMTINYRESYNIFAVSGILFNHESELRGFEFVTRKITNSIARIKSGKMNSFSLGNLDAKRDWGYAGDYVIGMHSMLQNKIASDYVLATGETYSVREFLNNILSLAEIKYEVEGHGLDESYINKNTGKKFITINPEYYREAEVDLLVGSPRKAEVDLGWKRKVDFQKLCELMFKADLKRNA